MRTQELYAQTALPEPHAIMEVGKSARLLPDCTLSNVLPLDCCPLDFNAHGLLGQKLNEAATASGGFTWLVNYAAD